MQPHPELPPDSVYYRRSPLISPEEYSDTEILQDGTDIIEEYEKDFTAAPELAPAKKKSFIKRLGAYAYRKIDPRQRFDTYSELSQAEKHVVLKNYMLKNMAKIALVTSPLTLYSVDVAANVNRAAAYEPSINIMSQPLDADNADRAIVLLQGFNTYDANYYAKKMGTGIQGGLDGEVWSVGYNNAVLSTTNIQEMIEETAAERGIKRVAIVGYSAGGVFGDSAATKLITDSSLKVDAIGKINSPDGVKTVREYQKNEMIALELFAKIPGILHSSPARFAGEYYLQRDRYTTDDIWKNIINMFTTVPSAIDRLTDEKATGASFLYQQVFLLSNEDIEENINTVADERGKKQMPVYFYLGTAEPGYDRIVDDKQSAKNICGYARNAGLACFDEYVPGANHEHYYREKAIEGTTQTLKNLAPSLAGAIDYEQDFLFESLVKPVPNDPVHHGR